MEKLSQENVIYKIGIDYKDIDLEKDPNVKKEIEKEALDYFIRKCRKIKRILRSAVGGKHRKFALNFEYEALIPKGKISYKIVHEVPKEGEKFYDVKFYENDTLKTWKELLDYQKELDYPKPA